MPRPIVNLPPISDEAAANWLRTVLDGYKPSEEIVKASLEQLEAWFKERSRHVTRIKVDEIPGMVDDESCDIPRKTVSRGSQTTPRKRGRPKGSKNKPKPVSVSKHIDIEFG